MDYPLEPNGDEMRRIVDLMGEKQSATGVKLLWGTANLFSHPRYMAGAATNPDPAVFAYACGQVKQILEATHRLGGAIDTHVTEGDFTFEVTGK